MRRCATSTRRSSSAIGGHVEHSRRAQHVRPHAQLVRARDAPLLWCSQRDEHASSPATPTATSQSSSWCYSSLPVCAGHTLPAPFANLTTRCRSGAAGALHPSARPPDKVTRDKDQRGRARRLAERRNTRLGCCTRWLPHGLPPSWLVSLRSRSDRAILKFSTS